MVGLSRDRVGPCRKRQGVVAIETPYTKLSLRRWHQVPELLEWIESSRRVATRFMILFSPVMKPHPVDCDKKWNRSADRVG